MILTKNSPLANCMIPYNDNDGIQQYFCSLMQSQFKCQTQGASIGQYSVCSLGTQIN